jgi:hypothetical protein
MTARRTEPNPVSAETEERILREILGYLNFSGGKPDPAFQRNWNSLFTRSELFASDDAVKIFLQKQFQRLREAAPAFADCSQAFAVLDLTFDSVLPAYRRHHADLLFHLQDADFRHPFFLVRTIEAVLQQGAPWNETDRITRGAISALNDFVGYRPVAVLENGRHMEPYPHERFRPVPLYLRDAGVAHGSYFELIERTIALLRETPPEILAEAHFDLSQVDELALDVRAHDHTHPVTKRTNYTFGEWDPHRIDLKGHYTRFVIRKIVVDSLLAWMREQKKLSASERLYDASAVLCGTMLMASAISGAGPETHDSQMNLISLLPKVARQRDSFYDLLLSQATGARRTRLRREAKLTQQPFGHIRQFLNIALAQHGAKQVQYRHVSQMYAHLGYPQAAQEQSALVPAASSRFETEIEWRLVSADRFLEQGDIREVARLLHEVEDYLDRGINCGALADPWNILGFQGMFPLFAAREDVIPDPRVVDLIEIVESLFGLYSMALGEAAALSNEEAYHDLSSAFERRAQWWDKFATTTVDELPKVVGRESWQSATRVAAILRAWRAAGEAAGDISFWRAHVEEFDSIKAYALVVDVLLRRRDHVAAMGLLIQWLSNAETVALEAEGYSLHVFLTEWMQAVLQAEEHDSGSHRSWNAIRRLFDFLEANAGSLWSVPSLAEALGDPNPDRGNGAGEAEENPDQPFADDESAPDEDSLFEAAYEGVVYRDSTRDGREGDTLESGPSPQTAEVDALGKFFEPRLRFFNTLAQLWLMAGMHFAQGSSGAPSRSRKSDPAAIARDEVIMGWRRKARALCRDLSKLADKFAEYDIDAPSGDHDENVEYDYQRHAHLYLLHSVVMTQVRLRMAERFLSACLPAEKTRGERSEGEERIVEVFRAVLHRDAGSIRRLIPLLRKQLVNKSLLYVALDGGGEPGPIRQVKLLQATLRFLLAQLPLAGCLRETWQLLQTAYDMERGGRPTGMVVSEFDQLFRAALKSTLECIVRSSHRWPVNSARSGAQTATGVANGRSEADVASLIPIDAGAPPARRRPWSRWLRPPRSIPTKSKRTPLPTAWYAEAVYVPGTSRVAQRTAWRNDQIVTMASDVVQRYMKLWLTHSRSMRLSSVEEMAEASVWKHVRSFVASYGAELFHAKMLTLGNIRTILDGGIESFLDHLDEQRDEGHPVKLLDDLYAGGIDSERAMIYLEMIYESIVDKFDRYVEYNTTTTHSDYGEKFYCLLDFLRTESAYERDAWNLSPIGLCHELFSECGRHDAARAWEQDFRARSARVAQKHLTRLRSLEKKYGMRLPTISDHLSEQFVKPLAVNRMRALLPRALQDARLGRSPSRAFEALRAEINDYLDTTMGSGIDVPAWLRALEREVVRLTDESAAAIDPFDAHPSHAAAKLSWNRLQSELQRWE